MNRIDRLTGMILLLQGHRVITAEQMAEHFEISVRTVYRDLLALGEAGVPIMGEAGVGYSLMRGYHIPPVMFTEDEAAALFLSGEIAEQVADESLRAALRSALLKVRSVLPRERHDYLNRLKKAVDVQLPASREGGNGQEHEREHGLLMPLQHAVVRRQRVSLTYDAGGRGEITTRTVEPLGILFYGKEWHLIAYCRLRQDFRDFRMDRIVGWKVLPEIFSGHEDFSLKAFLADEISRHELTPVTAVFRSDTIERVRREWRYAPKTEQSLPDGRVKVEILAWSVDWIAGWLLGFGDAMEILQPTELRERVRQAALAIADNHGRRLAGKPA
ncbi:MAG TPA: YafY family protein [Chthoniobacterales bacterium]